jgi:hypothetical protein
MSPISSRNKRAAVGLLEAAAPHGLRAGEGAALMAEQLALEQVFRNGRGVDRHKGAVVAGTAARGVLVQRARHQFLASARLTGDHDRDVALAQPADGAKHILHGRGLAQHLGRGLDMLLGHLLTLAFLDRAPDQLDRLGQIKGFGQVFEGARPERPTRHCPGRRRPS